MTFIHSSEVVEKGIEMAELYRPSLEDMFDVDLSQVNIKHTSDVADDFMAFSKTFDSQNPETYLEEVLASQIKWTGELDKSGFALLGTIMECKGIAHYYNDLDTMYLSSSKLFDSGTLAMSVVHELGHAIVGRFVPEKDVPLERDLWLHVDEGFAEYLALNTFLPHYQDSEARWVCQDRSMAHLAMANMLVSFEDIFRMSGKEYEPPQPDKDKFDPHWMGYRFFVEVCKTGISPESIVFNPPQHFSEILHPDEYLNRVLIQ